MEIISAFEEKLSESMTTLITQSRAQGTVGMSEDCFRQCLPSPPTSLKGAPRGTNKIWLYGQMLAGAIERLPAEQRDFITS